MAISCQNADVYALSRTQIARLTLAPASKNANSLAAPSENIKMDEKFCDITNFQYHQRHPTDHEIFFAFFKKEALPPPDQQADRPQDGILPR